MERTGLNNLPFNYEDEQKLYIEKKIPLRSHLKCKRST